MRIYKLKGSISAVLCIILILFPCRTSAQKDIIGTIKQILGDYNYPSEWTSDRQAYHLSCTIKTTMRAYAVENVSKLEVFVGRNQSHFISDNIEIYQDATSTFFIDHQRKSISISDLSRSNQSSLKSSREMASLQDSLLTYCSVRSSNEVKGGNGELLQSITLEVNEKGKRKFGVQSMTIALDLKKQTLSQVSIIFTAESKVMRMDTIYHALDKSYVTDRFSNSLSSLFFAKNNVLNSKYKEYQVDDMRSK